MPWFAGTRARAAMGVRNRSLNTALSAFKISAKAIDKVLGITYRNEIAVGTELVFHGSFPTSGPCKPCSLQRHPTALVISANITHAPTALTRSHMEHHTFAPHTYFLQVLPSFSALSNILKHMFSCCFHFFHVFQFVSFFFPGSMVRRS